MPSNNFKTAVPVIASLDVMKTVEYFEGLLGFEREWIWGGPPIYAGLRAGTAMLYISHDPEFAGAIKERNLAPDIYFWVEDIHAIYERHPRLQRRDCRRSSRQAVGNPAVHSA